ncbi:FtsW/RodA/SpoVE family cell cycle protein [Anaerocolumna sp. AGMB13020]|uniref:FtsW/RodA/SpoVE family cell cycle protein n=1 Tax=Anaerocolumna sp. AGMB13020 TaxID=3081750 RepID=UPI00295535F0|nr:FtsW/RodA/SpoVE family cell cycle protein [Anaerocolumna sp. AGMB13020]WOO35914.1 FtsW/RodA/SpoVE family cell cycle protein [Anaerocolumna sp. AGMB13020]
MESVDKLKEYKEEVCKQIRWKRVHEPVARELEAHMMDQVDNYLRQGDSEETAVYKTILDMGDPVAVGTQLDRIHRPKSQISMIIFTISLLLIGLVIQTFLVHDIAHPVNLPKLIVAAVLGIGFMFLAYYGDFTLIGRYPKALLLATVTISVGMLIVAPEVNGRPYFFISTFVTFSLACISLILPLALTGIIFVTRKYGYIGLFLLNLVILGLTFLTYRTSSIGNAAFFFATAIILTGAAIYKGWYPVNKKVGYIIEVLTSIATLVVVFLQDSYYIVNRLQIVMNPGMDAYGKGYFGVMIRELLHNARFVGKGVIPEVYNHSVFPLPSIHSDYLLTYFIINWGWLFFCVLLVVFAVFLICGFRITFRQKNLLGFLVSLAVMLTITFETCNYIAWNLGFLLVSPITLPLISYGNAALCIHLFLIGIMLSVFRSDSSVSDTRLYYQKGGFIQWKDRCLTIDFNKYRAD